MTRPLRIEFPGAVYHIINRGNARQNIYLDDEDRQDFLFLVKKVVKRFNWLCHGYCLMDNHYHLLIETITGNLSQGMRQLNGEYTQRFNKRHNTIGHIFHGRYKSLLVEKEEYLLQLSRYIVLNPVRAGKVKQAGQWEWSSYLAMVGEIAEPVFLTTSWVLSQFTEKNRYKATQQYIKFIDEQNKEDIFNKVQAQIILGGNSFQEKIKKFVAVKLKSKEISRQQRYIGRKELAAILEVESDENILIAYNHGYRMREIADKLGVHYSTVSRVIKKLEKR